MIKPAACGLFHGRENVRHGARAVFSMKLLPHKTPLVAYEYLACLAWMRMAQELQWPLLSARDDIILTRLHSYQFDQSLEM
ncbi:hypothetical protein [Pseudomonas sp. SJZ131]|uniref:hypothetical protein n=1 Tax=Pseudomonas sp. SJZ131 TaxID=2572895 RepID=UPI0011A41FE6|nr:hypothetical protein [Pseudomonas sp. SJZ131]